MYSWLWTSRWKTLKFDCLSREGFCEEGGLNRTLRTSNVLAGKSEWGHAPKGTANVRVQRCRTACHTVKRAGHVAAEPWVSLQLKHRETQLVGGDGIWVKGGAWGDIALVLLLTPLGPMLAGRNFLLITVQLQDVSEKSHFPWSWGRY